MKLEDLLSELDVLQTRGDLSAEVRAVTADSRKAGPGVLFVAIRGTAADGHRFVEAALAAGASGALVSDEAALGGAGTRVLVADGRAALARLALRLQGHPERRLALVGITGTNGKSTSAHLTAQLLEASLGRPVGLLGTLGGRVGRRALPHSLTTPDAVTLAGFFSTMLEEGADTCVMEVSSHAIAQQRVLGLSYRVAVYTNLSANEHLDYHGTFEEYRATKLRLFSEYLAPDGTAVINADDASALRFLAVSQRALTYGVRQPADLAALDVQAGLDGSRFVLRARGRGEHTVALPVPGLVNVYNWLAAAGVALTLGVELEAVLEATPRLEPVRGRLEPVRAGQPFGVYVDFAHTPAALESVLTFVRKQASGRVVVLFGAGGDRDRTKRPLMGETAAALADEVVLTSDNPRSESPEAILDEIAAGLPAGRCRREADRRKAIALALSLAQPGDVVLLAGKGHETTQEIAGRVTEFDDRLVALECLRELGYEA